MVQGTIGHLLPRHPTARRLRILGLPLPRRRAWIELLVLGTCVAMPIAVATVVGRDVVGGLYVAINEHALIEGFCSLVALMIAGMAVTIAIRQRNAAAFAFAAAFLSMGCFDLLHAVTDPHEDNARFVLYHTFSTGCGGLLIFVAASLHLRAAAPKQYSLVRSAQNFLLGGSFVALAGLCYAALMPRVAVEDAGILAFSPIIYTLHKGAAVLYTVTAIMFYRHFHGRRVIGVLLAILLILFAESAYLFSFSTMWDFHWWMWHGVKATFYVGTLISVFGGFVAALSLVERSRRILQRANLRLRETQSSIQRVNEELYARNRMAQEVMRSMNLSNALEAVTGAFRQIPMVLRWWLVLKAEEGGADEFRRIVAKAAGAWRVDIEASDNDGRWSATYDGPGLGGETAEVCLPLVANGVRIGHVRAHLNPGHESSAGLQRLTSLVAEIGPIINNSLLHDDLIEANEFRSALLRIGAQLASPLNLSEAMAAVCREGARLLDADGVLIWAPMDEGDKGEIASWCACAGEPTERANLQTWLAEDAFWRKCAAFAGTDGAPKVLMANAVPDSLVAGIPGHDKQRFGAMAIFPLVHDQQLVGVMLLFRRDDIRFGPATVAKGELLAGQVRAAIVNARSYRQLAAINSQLREAEEIRARGERLAFLGQMAASVAHEVRNPLAAISNCLAVLRTDRSVRGSGASALEIIGAEVQRLNKLTSDFLDFGRPRPPQRKPIILADVVAKVRDAIERHIAQEEMPVSVTVQIQGPRYPVFFDRDGLEAVLWNLVLNAAQSIDAVGRVEITLRHCANRILLAVVDSGRGIPAEQLPQVFEPFFSRRSHGVGLGLAIVARHVQEWRGRIRISSSPGIGTAFFIRAPIADDGRGNEAADMLVDVA